MAPIAGPCWCSRAITANSPRNIVARLSIAGIATRSSMALRMVSTGEPGATKSASGGNNAMRCRAARVPVSW